MMVGLVKKTTGNWEINCKLHSMCYVWARTGRSQSSSRCISVVVPNGWLWLVLVYRRVGGIHI